MATGVLNDANVPPRSRVAVWLRRLSAAVGLWVVGLPLLMVLSATPWAKHFLVPSVDRLLYRATAMPIPASFQEQRRLISGGLDPDGYFSATVASSDVEHFRVALTTHAAKDRPTNGSTLIGSTPPTWWSSPSWTDDEMFDIRSDSAAFRVHLSPSTGRVEIEWAKF